MNHTTFKKLILLFRGFSEEYKKELVQASEHLTDAQREDAFSELQFLDDQAAHSKKHLFSLYEQADALVNQAKKEIGPNIRKTTEKAATMQDDQVAESLLN